MTGKTRTLIMRRTNVLFKTGLIAIIVAFVSILNIFAFKNSQAPAAVSAIRGVAFYDCNSNGLKTAGEAGFDNLGVTLTGRNSMGDTVTMNTTTDASGLYAFTGVSAGSYRVKFTFPTNAQHLAFTLQNQGNDEGADSDPNMAGFTDALTVDGVTDIAAVDAGIIDSFPPTIVFTNPMIAGLKNGDTVTVSCDNLPGMDASWAKAINNSGGADLPLDFEDISIRYGTCTGDGFIQLLICTWTAKNICGVQNQAHIYIKTTDTKAPVLTAPNDTTINLLSGEQVPLIPNTIPFTDNCTNVTLTYRETEAKDPCGKIINRIWTGTDACGNQSSDTQRITVKLNPLCNGTPATDTIVIGPFSMTGLTQDTCLATYLGSGRTVKGTWSMGSANGVSATIKNDSCITLTRTNGYSGTDTIGGWHCDATNSNCRYLLIIVKISPDNPSCAIIPFDSTMMVSTKCGVRGNYCISGLNDISQFKNTYTITDNGGAYAGGYMACSNDTAHAYEYHTFPFVGKSGAYRLDYWKINGVNKTVSTFDSVRQLVDSMKVIDPTGNWTLDTATYSIKGGKMGTNYGQMKVTKISNGQSATTNVTLKLTPKGIQLDFAGGVHNVIFTSSTGCHDTLRLNIKCDSLPVAKDDTISTLKDNAVTINVLSNDTLKGTLVGAVKVINTPKGNTTIDGSNNIRYTPQSGVCGGKDTVQYSICNANGCDTGMVVVTINCPLLKPDAVDDTFSSLKDSTVTITVLTNDTLNGTLVGNVVVLNTKRGMSTVNGSNQIVFIPQTGFCGGNDTIEYKICNAVGCDSAIVVVSIACSPIYPVAVNDTVSTIKDQQLTINALANDTLKGSLVGSLKVIRTVIGSSTVNGSNQIVYKPLSGYCGGVDTIYYSICNAYGCDTAVAIVTINCSLPVLPIALNDSVVTGINKAITISVLNNDTTNGVLTKVLAIIKTPKKGMASVNGSNQVVYTPQSDYCGGTDTLSYQICNIDGCDTAMVLISVKCPPIAVNDTLKTNKNTVIAFNPTHNDTLNGTLSGLTIVTMPNNGGISFAGSDSLVYTPINGYCGKDTVVYRICNQYSLCDTGMIIVTVDCQGDTSGKSKPAIAVDDNVKTKKNTSLDIAALLNDTISGGLSEPMTIIKSPSKGTASVNGILISYSPKLDYCGGTDTLSYRICNTNGCDTGWVYITIQCDSSNINKNQPIALDDTLSTGRNKPVLITPVKNDTLNGTLFTMSIVASAKHGSVGFTATDTLIYNPQLGFCGKDTILYSICNNLLLCDTASIIVNVTCDSVPITGKLPVAVNDSAVAKLNQKITISVLPNDTINGGLSKPLSIVALPKHGTATVAVNDISYTPNNNYCGGKDTISYEICNPTGCDTAIVVVTVTCDTTLPIAVNDNIGTRINVPIRFKPSTNDTLSGILGSINVIVAPNHGSASVINVDTIEYIPTKDFCGKDTMQYSVCRIDGKCDTAFVFFTVSCSTGFKPDAVDDMIMVNKNKTTPIQVLSNDAINGVLMSKVAIAAPPKRGTASVNASNNIVYQPNIDYCGKDTLRYVICNADGCDFAFVFIDVSCDAIVNLPDARNDYATAYKNKSTTISPLTNDILNGVLDSMVIIVAPKKGTAKVNGTGIDYTPELDFCANNDTLKYAICNVNGCDTAEIIIAVKCDSLTGQAPVAVKDSQSISQGRPITISVLLNDSLFGATLDTAYIIESPRHGTARFDSFYNIYYTPNLSFCGDNDTLQYAICTAYGCDTTLVVIHVTCDSLATQLPIAINDNATTSKGKVVIIPILSNDTLKGADNVRIVTFTKKGSSVLNINYNIVYQPDSIFCDGNDTLTYEICNIAGCDTAIVVINVTCDSISSVYPIANNDSITTKINESVGIDIIKNDSLRGASKAELVNDARHGLVLIDNNNKAFYRPSDNFWGMDTFTYRICNSKGCDTATVIVKVVTNDSIYIYSGFSPNFDGMNDKYIIRGIDNYPDNELLIYNRWGVLIYQKDKYTNDDAWDGTWYGKYVPDGTYFYILYLDKAKTIRKTGYLQIHR